MHKLPVSYDDPGRRGSASTAAIATYPSVCNNLLSLGVGGAGYALAGLEPYAVRHSLCFFCTFCILFARSKMDAAGSVGA